MAIAALTSLILISMCVTGTVPASATAAKRPLPAGRNPSVIALMVCRPEAQREINEVKVTAISPAADPKSRVFSVELSIQNQNNRLKSGMIATLSVPGQQLARAVTAIPIGSVIRDAQRQDGFAVMVAEGQGDVVTARLRAVQLGDATET